MVEALGNGFLVSGGDEAPEIAYTFAIEDERLVLIVRGVEGPTVSEDERELCRAIIEAVVDEQGASEIRTAGKGVRKDRGGDLAKRRFSCRRER